LTKKGNATAIGLSEVSILTYLVCTAPEESGTADTLPRASAWQDLILSLAQGKEKGRQSDDSGTTIAALNLI